MTEERKHFQKRKVNLRFVYCMCSDVSAVREFYSGLLGMEELGFMDTDQFGWAGYDSEGMQLMFFRWDEDLPARTGWDWQPGDGAGEAPGMSFSIELPEEESAELVEKIGQAELQRMSETPTWRQGSYWGWTVRDPAGNTVELYWHPAEKPSDENPVWPG